MENNNTPSSTPSFSSLTAIMERFQTVPYDQFQQELQSWFEQGLAPKAELPDTGELQQSPGFQKLGELISSIYHQAEVSQTLTENQIIPRDDHK